MFCIDPAHRPTSMPRQSLKYRQASEFGPRGSGVAPSLRESNDGTVIPS
ncbi:hypothetical protein ABH941_000148 [Streptacidiphilus sp. EB103A]